MLDVRCQVVEVLATMELAARLGRRRRVVVVVVGRGGRAGWGAVGG